MAVRLDGETTDAMAYIMDLKMDFGLPSPYYYQTVLEGYHDCGLDTDVLDEAIKDSMRRFYTEYGQKSNQQTLFNYGEGDDDLDEGYGEEEELERNDAPVESDPFSFSDGWHW